MTNCAGKKMHFFYFKFFNRPVCDRLNSSLNDVLLSHPATRLKLYNDPILTSTPDLDEKTNQSLNLNAKQIFMFHFCSPNSTYEGHLIG